MRHLSLIETIPTREELRARIPHRERYQPEPRLLLSPELRALDDGYAEMRRVRKKDSWRKIHPMHVETIRALEDGSPMAAIIERSLRRCPPKYLKFHERFVRKFVWELAREGYVEVPLETPPAVFADRYERVKELGRGGMGVVHLCRDQELGGHLVVVKHAWGFVKAIEKAEQNVRAEAHALAQLDHPRIPGLIDAFERDGLLHLVRAYAPGEPLLALEPRPWDAPSADRMMLLRGCADALAHIHERGMLYLDVKPDNFLAESLQDGPLLLDVGLCRPHVDGELKLRGAVGSPGYAAPEIVGDLRASVRSDVYSLGRMFACLATGRRFKFKHNEADVDAALREAGVPAPEHALVLKMCAKDPARRYASMREVMAAIP